MKDYFECWKNTFLTSVFYDFLEWNPEKTIYYINNPKMIPLFPKDKKKISEVIEVLKELYLSDNKNSYSLGYGKNLDKLNKSIFKVLDRHSQKANKHLKSIIKQYREQIETISNKERKDQFVTTKKAFKRNNKLPKHLTIHLLQPLIEFQGKSAGFELFRKFIFEDFHEWRRDNNIKIDYTLPSIPSEAQESTLWARKLKSYLLTTLTKNESEKKRIIHKIKMMNSRPNMPLIDSAIMPFSSQFDDINYFKKLAVYRAIKKVSEDLKLNCPKNN